MRVVIIGGLPCSGKSKLAERLRARLSLPLLSKDEYKELLFDCLGARDRAWSRRLSEAAYALMFTQASQFVSAQCSCILEGNFRQRQHADDFESLARQGAQFVQVSCKADPGVLVARFIERARSGRRHAGHADMESLPEIERELRGSSQAPLALAGELIVCDTTRDWSAAIDRAIEQVLPHLSDAAR